MINDGTNMGGFPTNYIIKWTSTKYIGPKSWFRLEFSDQYKKFDTISCTFIEISSNLPCSWNGRVIYIMDLPSGIIPGTYRIKILNIINPFINGKTNQFIFETMEPGVNTVVEYYNVDGTEIKPGQVSDITVEGYPLNMNLRIDYTIKFTPKNQLPEGGEIKFTFPSTFGALDSTCRIIRGLVNGASPITCTSSGKTLTIKNFAAFTPQFIELKIFAVNPNTPGQTPVFKVETYESPGATVDYGEAPGVQISNIDKPYYLFIDLYKKMDNMTLNQWGPLDFRVYPKPANVLPITPDPAVTTASGEIYLQLPLWWENVGFENARRPEGYTPLCTNGKEPSALCNTGTNAHNLLHYFIKTLKKEDVTKYGPALTTAKVGLGECDLPLSIERVKVTPIPGKWDFRVLTFKDSTSQTFTQTPLEQDIFTMDIVVEQFNPIPYLYSTSRETEDIDNIMRVRFRVGLKVPTEGSFNLRFISKDDVFSNTAGWPQEFGIAALATNSFVVVPCRIKVGTDIVGYPEAPKHKTATCMAYKGDSATNKDGYLQVTGFSEPVLPNTDCEFDIPNIKYCKTKNMNCKVELFTAYTIALTDPYILNYYKGTVGFVADPGLLAVNLASGNFAVTLSKSQVCEDSTWSIKMELPSPLKNEDHLLLKFPLAPFNGIFKREGVTFGAIGNVDVIIVNTEIYYLIRITTNVAAGVQTFSMGPIRNSLYLDPAQTTPNYHNVVSPQGIVVGVILWASQFKIHKYNMGKSAAWTDGGILNGLFETLPLTNPNRGSIWNFDEDAIQRITFYNCHPVPKGGAIVIYIPHPIATYYASVYPTKCFIYEGIHGDPEKLGSKVKCTQKTSASKSLFEISGFNLIPSNTKMRVVFRIKTKGSSVTGVPQFMIRTFTVAKTNADDYNENQLTNSEHLDYNLAAANYFKPPDMTGPQKFPNKWQFANFIKDQREVRVNDRGPLVFTVTPVLTDIDSTVKINVNFGGSITTLPWIGVIHCRVNGFLVRTCNYASNQAIITVPPTVNVLKGNPIKVEVGSRRADWSATGREGLVWRFAGFYTLTVEIEKGGSVQEYVKKKYEILPQAFDAFWVWSANKNMHHNTGGTIGCNVPTLPNCGLTFVRIFFRVPFTIVADANTQFTVFMHVRTGTEYTQGFAKDLGTGQGHNTDLPCDIKGIAPATGAPRIQCRLYHGAGTNPAKVFITKFGNINGGTFCEINLPKIYNPIIDYEVVRVQLRLDQVDAITKKSTPILENSYYLVNTTYQRPLFPSYNDIKVTDLSADNSFALYYDNPITVDTDSVLNVKFKASDHPLDGGDAVVFELPKYFQFRPTCTLANADAQIKTACDGYYDVSWLVLYPYALLAKSTSKTVKVNVKTIPFKYKTLPHTSEQIMIYIFSRSKLIEIVKYPPFNQALTTPTIPASSLTIVPVNPELGASTDYVVSFRPPKDIPGYGPGSGPGGGSGGGGGVKITLPPELVPQETKCRNDKLGGSDVNDGEYKCDITGQELWFNPEKPVKAGELMKFKVRLQNPASGPVGPINFETFYQNKDVEPTPTKVMAEKSLPGPTLTAAATPVPVWNSPKRTRHFMYINDKGTLVFRIKVSNQVDPKAAGTPADLSNYYIDVKMPTQFTIPLGAQVHCMFDYEKAYNVEYISGTNTIRCWGPQSTTLLKTRAYWMNITTMNAASGDNGFVFPSVKGSYKFEVEVHLKSDNSLVEKGETFLYLTGPKMNSYSTSTIIVNQNQKTAMLIKFNPTADIDFATGKIVLMIPVMKYDLYTKLVDEDHGIDRAPFKFIGCTPVTNFPTDVDLSCTYAKGNIIDFTEMKITVTFTYYGVGTAPTKLNQGVQYEFFIDGLMNPVAGSDDKQVYVVTEIYNGATLVNGDLNYDYTIMPIDPIPEAVYSYQPSATDTAAGSTGVTWTLNMKTSVKLDALAQHDFYIVEFPKKVYPQIFIKLQAHCNPLKCWIGKSFNWVVVKAPDVPIGTYTFKIYNLFQHLFNEKDLTSGVHLIGYVIKNRKLIETYKYGENLQRVVPMSGASGLTFSISALDVDASRIPMNTMIPYLFTFQLPAVTQPTGVDIADTGILQLTFPTGYVVDDFCQPDDTTKIKPLDIKQGVTCIKDPGDAKSFKITGFKKILRGEIVKIVGHAKSTTAQSSPSVKLDIFNDQAKAEMLYTTTSNGPDVQNKKGLDVSLFQNLQGNTKKTVVASATNYNPLVFNLKIGFSFVANSYLMLSFPSASGITVPASTRIICSIGGHQCYCRKQSAGAGESLKVKMTLPHDISTISTNTVHEFHLSTTCGPNQAQGLLFPNAGSFGMTIEIYNTALLGSFSHIINVGKADFSVLEAKYLWSNKDKATHLAMKMQPSANIPEGGYILIGFPRYTADMKEILTKASLGLSGSTINCFSADKSTMTPIDSEISCSISDSNKHRVEIFVRGFQQLLSTKTMIFIISGLKTPDVETTLGVKDFPFDLEIEAYSDSNSLLMQKQIIDFTAPVDVSSSSTSITPTLNPITLSVQQAAFEAAVADVTIEANRLHAYSRVVFEFPEDHDFPISVASSSTSNPGGTFEVYHHVVIWSPLTIVPGSVITKITLKNLVGASGTQSSVPKIYIVYDRAYEKVFTFSPIVFNALATALEFTHTTTSDVEKQWTTHYFEIKHNAKLPGGGAIQISFGGAGTINNAVQIIAGLSSELEVIKGSNLIITLKKDYAASSDYKIKLSVIVANAAPGSYNIQITSYASGGATPSKKILDSTPKSITIVAASPAHTDLSSNCRAYFTKNSQDDMGDLVFLITPSAALPTGTLSAKMVSNIQVKSGTCSFKANAGSAVTGSCSGTSNTFSFPDTDLNAVGVESKIVISQMDAQTVSSMNSAILTIDDGSAGVMCNAAPLKVLGNKFSSATLTLPYAEIGKLSFVKVTFKPPASVSSGRFYLEVPYSYNPLTNSNPYVPCEISSFSNLKCKYVIDTNKYYRRIEMVSTPVTFASGTTYTLYVYRTQNYPTVGDMTFSMGIYSTTSLESDPPLPLYSITDVISFVDSSITATTQNLAKMVNPFSFKTTTSTTVTLPNSNVGGGKALYMFFNERNSEYSATPTLTFVSNGGSCTFRAVGRMIECPSGASPNTKIKDFQTPFHQMPNFIGLYAFIIDSGVMTSETHFLEPTTPTPEATLAAEATYVDSTNSFFSVKLTLLAEVPEGGSILWKTTGFSSLAASQFEVLEGNFVGDAQISVNGNNIHISGFTLISAGVFRFRLKVKTAGSGTQTQTFETYADSGTTPTLLIEKGTASLNFATSSTFMSWNIHKYLYLYHETISTEKNRISILFKFNSLVFSGTKTLEIKPNTALLNFAGVYAKPPRLMCLVSKHLSFDKHVAEKCHMDIANNRILVTKPPVTTLTNTLYRLDIFLDEVTNQGFQLSNVGRNSILFNLLPSYTSSTPSDIADIYFNIHASTTKTQCFIDFYGHVGMDNALSLSFTTTSALGTYASGARMFVGLQTMSYQYAVAGTNLFPVNLKAGNNALMDIGCEGVTGITSTTSISCSLYVGGGDPERFVYVSVDNFNAIAANTLVKISIRDIYNPAVAKLFHGLGVFLGSWTNSQFVPTEFFYNFKGIYTLAAPSGGTTSTETMTIADGVADTTLNIPLAKAFSTSSETLEEMDTFAIHYKWEIFNNYVITSTLALPSKTLQNFVTKRNEPNDDIIALELPIEVAPYSLTGNLNVQINSMKYPSKLGLRSGYTFLVETYKNRKKVHTTTFNVGDFNVLPDTTAFIIPSQWMKLYNTPGAENPVQVPKNSRKVFFVKFTFNHYVPSNSDFLITFGTYMDLSKGDIVKITSGYTDPFTFTKPSAQVLKINFPATSSPITKGTVFDLQIEGQTADAVTAVTANLVTLKTENGGAKVGEQTNIQTFAVIDAKTIPVFIMEPVKYAPQILHGKETGPIWFYLENTVLIDAARKDYIEIVDVSTPGVTLWKEVLTGGSYKYEDLECYFIMESNLEIYTARDCYEQAKDNYRIVAPAATNIPANTKFWVFIGTLRIKTAAGVGQTYDDFEYADYKADSLFDIRIRAKNGGSNGNLNAWTPDKRSIYLPQKDFARMYSVNFVTTKDEYAMLKLHMKVSSAVPAYTSATKGQIIIEIPTKFPVTGEASPMTGFLPDLGSGFKTGDEIECLCNTCSQPVKCYIFEGAAFVDSPVIILIGPQNNLVADDVIDINIPRIKMPVDKYVTPVPRLFARKFVSGKFELINEFVFYDAFRTTIYSTVVVNLPAGSKPVFAPNLAGQPGTITFSFTTTQGDIVLNSNDRFILETKTPKMVVEHPPAPDKTTCTQGNLNLFTKNGWIEVIPTSTISQGSINLNFQKMLNKPVSDGTGIDYTLFVWKDTDLRMKFIFPTTDPPAPGPVDLNTYNPLPAPVKGQPNEFELAMTPKTPIPPGGFIEIQLPDCAACDWSWNGYDTNCAVTGLIEPTCDIDTVNKKIIVKNPVSAYCPAGCTGAGGGGGGPTGSGPITIKFEAQNPSTTAASGLPIKATTYYSETNKEVIGQNNNLATYTLSGGNVFPINLDPLYWAVQNICGGETGPVRFTFNLHDDLTYPDDYLRFFHYGLIKTPNYNWGLTEELICYFNDNSVTRKKFIKSFRCQFIGDYLDIYVPEELSPMTKNKDYELVLTSRYNDGVEILQQSGIYWVRLTTSKGTGGVTNGWQDVIIPPCLYAWQMNNNLRRHVGPTYCLDPPNPPATNVGYYSTFYVESLNAEASKEDDHTAGASYDPTYTVFNITLRSGRNHIYTGNNINFLHSRFIVEIWTHNELDPVFRPDLGLDLGANNEIEGSCASDYEIAENGVVTRPLPLDGLNYLRCRYIQADGIAYNKPAYVVIENFADIGQYATFGLQIARIGNPKMTGTTSHLRIKTQTIQLDGTYADVYDHPAWHVVYPYLQPPNSGGGAKSVGANGLVATLNMQEKRAGFNIERWSFTATIGSNWQCDGDSIVYAFSSPWVLNRRAMCYQSGNINSTLGCTTHQVANWWLFSYTIKPETASFNANDNWNNINPIYEIRDVARTGNPVPKLHIWVWKQRMLIHNLTHTPINPKIMPAYIVLQTPAKRNDPNLLLKYKIGVFLSQWSEDEITPNGMAYIRIEIPKHNDPVGTKSFIITATTCTINKGISLKDFSNPADAIVCKIKSGKSAPYHHYLLEVFNFGPYRGDGFVIIELEMKNPPIETWTDSWRVTTYPQFYDDNTLTEAQMVKVMDHSYDTGRTWIGSQGPPKLFRVYRNTVGFENRRAQKNDYAEIHTRLKPKTTLPNTKALSSGRVEVWMPVEFEMPNGGKNLCVVGNNKNDVNGLSVQKDLEANKCEFRAVDRKIIMHTNPDEGLLNVECSLLTATTEGAVGGDGIKLPDNPDQGSFEVFEYKDNNLVEYSKPGVLTKPVVIDAGKFGMTNTFAEISHRTVVQIWFETPIIIPAGYDTSSGEIDPLKKNPVGQIRFLFNTRTAWLNTNNGFSLDLGMNSAKYTMNNPCKVISGLVPKAGENILCKVTASIQYSIFEPAVITISNYEQIAANTKIEVHFIDVINCQSVYNDGKIEIEVKKTLGTGQVIDMILPTAGYVPRLSINNDVFPAGEKIITPTKGDITFSVNSVGAYTIIDIEYEINQTIAQQDQFVLEFPLEYELKYQKESTLQASMEGHQLTPIIYAVDNVNYLYLEIPTGKTIPYTGTFPAAERKKFRISQFRNAAYVYSGTKRINFWILDNKYRIKYYYFDGITSPSAGPFSSNFLVLSSYFAEDVYVTYTFTLIPTYRVPSGSNIIITLPNFADNDANYPKLSYTHFPTSNPPATSESLPLNYLTNTGVIQANKLSLSSTKEIAEKTTVQITVKGARNPAYVGTTANNHFCAVIYRDSDPNRKINEACFSPITFLKAKNPDIMFMKIEATTLYQGVEANYKFTIQNTNLLPVGGEIYLTFPVEWAPIIASGRKIDSLTGSFTDGKLVYTDTYPSPANTVKIVTNFEWPAKTALKIEYFNLKNPLVSQTSVFKSNSVYDGRTLDQSDPQDIALKLAFQTFKPGVSISNLVIGPKNEAEVATYSMDLTSPSVIPKGGVLEFSFPGNYAPELTTYDKKITCTLGNRTLPCTVKDRRLEISIDADIPASEKSQLKISGIMNPNIGAAQSINILTRNGTDILGYTNNAFSVQSIKAPPVLNMTKLSTTSTNIQDKSNYTFCIESSYPIHENTTIYFEFPKQFKIRSTTYSCVTSSGHNAVTYDNTSFSPGCSAEPEIRRISIKNHTSTYNGADGNRSMCYEIQNVENPGESGESGNFVVSIYDEFSKEMVAKTFGNLLHPSTITYKLEGLRILVDAIKDIVRGLLSEEVIIKLERSVPYVIKATPNSPGFNFIPPVIEFLPHLGPIQKFRIQPLNGTALGQHKIAWTKVEVTSDKKKFSDIADTFFNLIATPAFKEVTATVGVSVSRTALNSTSLPIDITLSHSPSTNMTVYYETIKPNQGEFVTFTPQNLTFQPGQTKLSLQYNTKIGALSGQIRFWTDDKHKDIYYWPKETINFEILDIDNTKPEIINYYIVSLGRTNMYFRISTTESVWVYYLTTLKGCSQPPDDEIEFPELRVQRKTKTDVIEITGKNSSFQTPVTQTYIYHDTYLDFVGLEEDTEYILFFLVKDLSNNRLGNIPYPFRTLKKQRPAQFQLTFSEDVNITTILNSLGVITGLSADRFVVNAAPKKFNIPGAKDPAVISLLSKGTTTYTFTILPNKTANEQSPLARVNQIENNKHLLKNDVPQFVDSKNILNSSFEVTEFMQEYTFPPKITDVGIDYATFNMSIKRSGKLYGVLMEKSFTTKTPNREQIKGGLDPNNKKLPSSYTVLQKYNYSEVVREGEIIWNDVKFNNLMDNTEYVAYFVSENNLPVNPDMMNEADIVKIPFVTLRDFFTLHETYRYSYRNAVITVWIILIMAIVM